MIIEAFVISIIVGLMRKGRLANLEQIRLRRPWLFVGALVLYALVAVIAGIERNHALLPLAKVANIVGYFFLLGALLINLRIKEFALAAFGTFLNFTALAANGGVMPMSPRALDQVGMGHLLVPREGHYFARHVLSTPETRLKILTDIIPVPGFGPIFTTVASIGDLIVALAVFILIQRYMCCPLKEPSDGG